MDTNNNKKIIFIWLFILIVLFIIFFIYKTYNTTEELPVKNNKQIEELEYLKKRSYKKELQLKKIIKNNPITADVKKENEEIMKKILDKE